MHATKFLAGIGMAALAISVFPLCACRHGGKSGGTSMGVFDHEGSYISNDGHHELAVSTGSDGLVSYALRDAHSGRESLTERYGSAHQRWFFYWDESGQLWYYNSDVDFLVYRQDSDGRWTRHVVRHGNEFGAMIPEAVKHNLPPTLKKKWGLL